MILESDDGSRPTRPAPRIWGLVLLLVAFFVAGVAAPRAEVVLTLSAHPGTKVAGVYALYPHAFIHLNGTLAATGMPINETIGFGATSFGPHLLFSRVPGEIGRPGRLQTDGGTDYISVPISDATYNAIMQRVDYWKTPEGGTYDLRRRNCIHFVIEIAEIAGLRAPRINAMSPNLTLIEAAALNPQYSLGPQGVLHSQRQAQDQAPSEADGAAQPSDVTEGAEDTPAVGRLASGPVARRQSLNLGLAERSHYATDALPRHWA